MKLENVRVKEKLPLQQGTSATGNTWQSQSYIVQGEGQYDKPICVECFGRKADEVVLQVDQLVTLNVDVESRNFNGRWYTSVRVWSVEQPAAPAQPTAPAPTQPAVAPVTFAPAAPQAPASVPSSSEIDESGELPF